MPVRGVLNLTTASAEVIFFGNLFHIYPLTNMDHVPSFLLSLWIRNINNKLVH